MRYLLIGSWQWVDAPIVDMKKPLILLIVLIICFLGWGIFTNREEKLAEKDTPGNQLAENNPPNEESSKKITPSSIDTSYYEGIFKKNGEWFGTPEIVDLTGDGKDEVVYTNVGEGCGSCHAEFFHIFQGKKEIFYSEFDDLDIHWDNKGFTVYQPIRLDNEPYAFSSSFSRTIYKWDGNKFVKESSSLDNLN